MKNILKRTASVVFPSVLVVITSFLFLNKLGQTPLKSWDEAWYAEIARNILKRNNWFLLWWNGLPYFDHPPFGFWLMALSFKIFGFSEFAARLASAITGIFSVILVYLIARQLFNEFVGLNAGLILITMPWFWLRSREGNLDIILTFLMLLSFYLAIKVNKNPKWLPLLAIIIGLMLLTKSVIGIGLLPVILFIILNEKPKITKSNLLFTVFCLLFTLIPWYLVNYLAYGIKFLDRNIFVTGLKLPGYGAIFTKSNTFSLNLKNSFLQIQNGILLWYKPFLLSLLGLIFIKKRSFQVIFLWLGIYLGLFSTSQKAELWHFIILYPAIALLTAAFMENFSEMVFKKVIRSILLKNLSVIIIFFFVLWNGGRIIKGLYKDIVKNQPLNDEVILGRLAGQNPGTIFIDDDYWPTAVFYAQKKIYSLPHSTDTNIKTVKQLFSEYPEPFQLLTKHWILDRDKIKAQQYSVIDKIGDRVLVKSK